MTTTSKERQVSEQIVPAHQEPQEPQERKRKRRCVSYTEDRIRRSARISTALANSKARPKTGPKIISRLSEPGKPARSGPSLFSDLARGASQSSELAGQRPVTPHRYTDARFELPVTSVSSRGRPRFISSRILSESPEEASRQTIKSYAALNRGELNMIDEEPKSPAVRSRAITSAEPSKCGPTSRRPTRGKGKEAKDRGYASAPENISSRTRNYNALRTSRKMEKIC